MKVCDCKVQDLEKKKFLSLEDLCTVCLKERIRIKEFKKHVLYHFIFGALFDMLISTASFLTDILSFYFYMEARKWYLALLALLLLILPTTVFTNVYLEENENGSKTGQGKKPLKYDQMTETSTSSSNLSVIHEEIGENEASPPNTPQTKEQNRFLQSLIELNNRRIRRRKKVNAFVQRCAKYFFGTLVLRLVASFWYFKAIRFGILAYRSPEKFLKIESPEKHWSYSLLLRLDFLSAALENAPQCAIQLYLLLTERKQNYELAFVTLIFSFVDFVRVTTKVLWNANKGPVIAPKGCFDSFIWKLTNAFSWIFLYFARCCALALVIATSQDDYILILPILTLSIHLIIFAFILKSKRVQTRGDNVHARKVLVTTFISIFFLPDLDLGDIHVLTQLYYAAIMLENTMFIIPWRGLDLNYCDMILKQQETEASPKSLLFLRNQASTTNSENDCLLKPEMVVISVPALTIVGIVLRLAAAQKLASFKANHVENPQGICKRRISTLMNTRISSIYQKNWAKLTFYDMFRSISHMIKKESELTPGCGGPFGENTFVLDQTPPASSSSPSETSSNSSTLSRRKRSLRKRSHSMIMPTTYTRTSSIGGNQFINQENRRIFDDSFLNLTTTGSSQDPEFDSDSSDADDEKSEKFDESPESKRKRPSSNSNSRHPKISEEFYTNLNIKFIKVETVEGETKIIETSWI